MIRINLLNLRQVPEELVDLVKELLDDGYLVELWPDRHGITVTNPDRKAPADV